MHCDICGFRAELWSDHQVDSTLSIGHRLAAQVRLGADPRTDAALQAVLSPVEDLPRGGTDRAALHALQHALHLAGRRRRSGTPMTAGSVVQVNVSDGGVPKRPVDRAAITWTKLSGDRQDDRRNHGRPWQAVCLWAAEVVDGLRAEGHPIGFGSAGENLTLKGLGWSALGPGVRLRVGTALLQVTSYAIPCEKNARWFSDGAFDRLSVDVRPHGSRLYAAVLEEGVVRPDDPVVVEPPPRD